MYIHKHTKTYDQIENKTIDHEMMMCREMTWIRGHLTSVAWNGYGATLGPAIHIHTVLQY